MSLGLDTIQGESNVMRYAARKLGFGESGDRADALLDEVHSALVFGVGDHQAALKALDHVLSREPTLGGGDDLRPCDFVVYSALVNSGQGPRATAAVKKWFVRCQALAGGGHGPATGKQLHQLPNNRRQRTKSKSVSKSKSPPLENGAGKPKAGKKQSG